MVGNQTHVGSMGRAKEHLDNKSTSRETTLHLTNLKATLGLKALLSLQYLHQSPPKDLPQPVLLSLLVFTSSRDPWTTPPSLSSAQLLLSKYAHQTQTTEFLINYILQSIIRPLFSKSKPSAITSSGRKAMPSSAPPKRFEAADMDRSTKPWKYEAVYSVTVFRRAVEHTPVRPFNPVPPISIFALTGFGQKDIISESWPLFIPPLLTLLDDTSNRIRSQGLEILTLFLPKLDAKMLTQTGLGEVFEDAIMPTLLFLPSLTPIDESMALLGPAYQSLYALGEVRYTEDEAGKREKLKFLDRVLRKGVLMGYLHASEYTGIVEVLMHVMGGLVRGMGVRAVKHLKVYSYASFRVFCFLLIEMTGYHSDSFNDSIRSVWSFASFAFTRGNQDSSKHDTKLLAEGDGAGASCRDH